MGPGNLDERGARSFKFHASVTPATVYPWGEALSVANDGTTQAAMFELTSRYPVSMSHLAGDGVETDVTLAYTPIDSAGADTHHIAHRDGVEEVLTSITPATKTTVFSSAIAADAHGTVFYEHLVTG